GTAGIIGASTRDQGNRRECPAMMRFISKLLGLALILLCASRGFAQQKPIDGNEASKYFQEMKTASERDAGHLWGIRLYGPMLFVDPETHFAVANQADAEGKLRPDGEVFSGSVPP